MYLILPLVLAVGLQTSTVMGHGRLVDPPSRASAWRFGFRTPKDYNDNQGFCGGFNYQYNVAGGKCGICGDPWGGPRPHEAPGGEFATGTITGTYKSGSVLPVTIQVTANHMGYFVFKLCPNNNPDQDPNQDCFDNYVLDTVEGGSRYYLPDQETRPYPIDLLLPPGLTCSQCILQWTYITGNSWGQADNGTSCVGCGPQENFRACSDIRIVGSDSQMNETSTTTGNGSTGLNTSQFSTTKHAEETTEAPKTGSNCKAIGAWSKTLGMNAWCQTNCNHKPPFCPRSHCSCD